nr:zinc finger-like domain-containing protein [uncultured Draconibacterium sp.]
MKTLCLFILFAFILLPAFSQEISDLKLLETWSYSVDWGNNNIRVKGGKIKNNDEAGSSGTIKIIIFLTTTKYDLESSPNGYIFAEYKFKPLDAGHQYYNINKTLSIRNKPQNGGNYYVTIMLLEYSNEGYVIIDYLNFKGYITVPNTYNDAWMYPYITVPNTYNDAWMYPYITVPNTYNDAWMYPYITVPNTYNDAWMYQQLNSSNEFQNPQPSKRKCGGCWGTGRCSVCKGTGTYTGYGSSSTCSGCNGTGKCGICNGAGYFDN